MLIFMGYRCVLVLYPLRENICEDTQEDHKGVCHGNRARDPVSPLEAGPPSTALQMLNPSGPSIMSPRSLGSLRKKTLYSR